MKWTGVTTLKMLGVVVLAISLISVWPGCKGSSTSGAGSAAAASHAVPVAVEAARVGGFSAAMHNPIIDPFWRDTTWYTLGSPSPYAPPSAATRVAVAYSRTSLYVAFVCTGPPPWFNPAAARSDLWKYDCSEIWLDSSRLQNGTNFYEIAIAPDGRVNEVWHRAAVPPKPTRAGGINLAQPFSLIPWRDRTLKVKTYHGIWRRQPAWELVVRVPLARMPRPLRLLPRAGRRLRLNLIRYQWHPRRHGPRRLVQYSLFSVPPKEQAFAPYRMGRLVLAGPSTGNLALAKPAN